MAGTIHITRDDLYLRVWQTPMNKLAKEFGISDSGLAKVCRRFNVPYPPRGYWARKRAGQRLDQPPLPPGSEGTPAEITISPTQTQSRARSIVKKFRLSAGDELTVPTELRDPHPLVRMWLADKTPRELTEEDLRRFRILDTIFRALERNGLAPHAEEDGFYFAFEQEKVSCSLNRATRPLRWETSRRIGRILSQPLILRFTIENYFPPMYVLRRRWSDSLREPLEAKVGDIVATLLAAGPLLARIRDDRAELQRRMGQRRYEAAAQVESQLLEDARLAALFKQVELHRDVLATHAFLDDLEDKITDASATIHDRTLKEWLNWARQALRRADPLKRGAAAVFEEAAKATARKS